MLNVFEGIVLVINSQSFLGTYSMGTEITALATLLRALVIDFRERTKTLETPKHGKKSDIDGILCCSGGNGDSSLAAVWVGPSRDCLFRECSVC